MSLEEMFLEVFSDQAQVLAKDVTFGKGYRKTHFDYIMKSRYDDRLFFVVIRNYKRILPFSAVVKLKQDILRALKTIEFRDFLKRLDIKKIVPVGIIVTNEVSEPCVHASKGFPQVLLVTRGLLVSSLRIKRFITINDLEASIYEIVH